MKFGLDAIGKFLRVISILKQGLQFIGLHLVLVGAQITTKQVFLNLGAKKMCFLFLHQRVFTRCPLKVRTSTK